MDNRTVNFQINIGGNAYEGMATLNAAMGKLNVTADKTTSLFDRLGAFSLKFNNIFHAAGSVVRSVAGTMDSLEQASNAQQEATAKLAQVKATFDQNQMRLFNVMLFELVFLSDRNYDFLVEE